MRDLIAKEIEMVYGGTTCCYCSCPPPVRQKGNNGWGNGADPTNPGSFSGKTAPSKSRNSSYPPGGKVNINPTDSNGR